MSETENIKSHEHTTLTASLVPVVHLNPRTATEDYSLFTTKISISPPASSSLHSQTTLRTIQAVVKNIQLNVNSLLLSRKILYCSCLCLLFSDGVKLRLKPKGVSGSKRLSALWRPNLKQKTHLSRHTNYNHGKRIRTIQKWLIFVVCQPSVDS